MFFCSRYPLIVWLLLKSYREGLKWSGWTWFQCWTTNISHQPTVKPPASTLLSPVSLAKTWRKALKQMKNTTYETPAVVPPTGRAKSSFLTTLETWCCLLHGGTEVRPAQHEAWTDLNPMCDLSSDGSPGVMTVAQPWGRGSYTLRRRLNGDASVFLHFCPQLCGVMGSVWGFLTVGSGVDGCQIPHAHQWMCWIVLHAAHHRSPVSDSSLRTEDIHRRLKGSVH